MITKFEDKFYEITKSKKGRVSIKLSKINPKKLNWELQLIPLKR